MVSGSLPPMPLAPASRSGSIGWRSPTRHRRHDSLQEANCPQLWIQTHHSDVMKNSKVLFTLGTQRTGFCLGVLTLACGLIGCGNASAAARRNHGAVKSKSGELVQGFRSDPVVIEGKSGNGSGFIASIKGRKFLVSNAHVLAGIRGPRLKLLDNSPL